MKSDVILVENKKAKLRFSVLETFSAGIELLGTETKSLRGKHGSLDGARVVVRGGEAYLIGASIPPHQVKNADTEYDAERPRRLLLKKSEVAELANAESRRGLTTVPLEMYNNRYIKVRIGIVQGKGKADRREDLKARDAKREVARLLKRN
jgi:SsrA-binding protein